MSSFRLMIISLTFISFFSKQVYAISEQNYRGVFESQVKPYFEQGGLAGEFAGIDRVAIRYKVFQVPNEIGAIVIVPGRTDPYAKFAELIYDLTRQGYSIYIYSHRGQGESDRLLKNRQISYVRHFSDYVKDLDQFVREVVHPESHRKKFLLAHSMGGAVSALYLAEHPDTFDAVALASPMFGIQTEPYPSCVAYAVANIGVRLGDAEEFALGQGPYNPGILLGQSQVTSSAPRWQSYHKLIQENPSLSLGGPSYQWVFEVLSAASMLEDLGAKIHTPMLVIKAGKDKIVDTSKQEKFCILATKCQLVQYSQSEHEILNETDSIRGPALQKITAFFSAE